MRKLFLIALYYGGALITYVDPFYGVLMYTFMNIVRPEQLAWGDTAFAGRIFLIMQAACFTSWVVNREKLTPEATPLPPQIKIMLIFAVTMMISAIFGVASLEPAWKWIPTFLKTTLFCFVMSKTMNTTRKLELYFIVVLGWFMFLEVWGIFQKLGGNPYMEGIGGEQLSNRNDLASVVVLYFPAAFYSLYSTKKWIKLFIAVPATIIFAIFILFTESRGGFLGLLACMIAIFLRTPTIVQKIKMILVFTLVSVLFLVVIIQVAPEGFFDSYSERLQTVLGEEDEETGEVEREDSSASRVAMWKATYYIMKHHPEFWITGMGVKGFMESYINYIDDAALYLPDDELVYVIYGGGGGRAIHNTYLNVLTSGGIMGFSVWIYLLFLTWKQAHDIPKNYPKIINGINLHNYAQAVEIGLIGFSVCSIFGNREFVDFYYWQIIMVGIMVNIGKAQLRREELGVDDE